MLIEYYDHKADKLITEWVDFYYDSHMDLDQGELVVKYVIDMRYKSNGSYDVLNVGEKRFPYGNTADRKLKTYYLISHNGIMTLERKSMPNKSITVRVASSSRGRSFSSIQSARRRCSR